MLKSGPPLELCGAIDHHGGMAKLSDMMAINLRLGLLGLPQIEHPGSDEAARATAPLVNRQRELRRRLERTLPAVDQRIQDFLDAYLEGTDSAPQVPAETFILDQPGLARVLSLPVEGDRFSSDLLSSYRIANGVLHNPANDRRTTKGVFHISEGGLPIQDDKLAVPKEVFGRLLERAFQPPRDALLLPYGAEQDNKPFCWASLLLRPIVVPSVPGFTRGRTMEVRFFAPGSMMANLDFVEGIFGNGGDPFLPDNDAALQPLTWTGTTGMVVLAPHLTKCTKKELGLPHIDEATARQRRDGMCWAQETELYNNGSAFKLCARDERGVIVTMIADNYFGYCKKEVKAHISYSTNFMGMVEEEHSGGASCFPSYNLGQHYTDNYVRDDHRIDDVVQRESTRFDQQPEGHALDRRLDSLILVPEHSTYSLRDGTVSWTYHGKQHSIALRSGIDYMGPDGYHVRMEQLGIEDKQWALVGTSGNATTCHKPATVSGGGKSEISKAITDAFISGNAFVADFDNDIAAVAEILDHDFTNRFADPASHHHDTRPILSDRRSLGSVIKLLTPSTEFTDEYNAWLEAIPYHIKELVFVVKRYYQPEWGQDWASHFSVGIINGRKGTSLRLDGEKIHVNMLRVGFEPDGSWRLFGLRHDFHPAVKVQTEDDITASIVAPPRIGNNERSRKYVENCELLLFQRPDDAIHRGYDKQTEKDMSQPGTFTSNFEPLTQADAQELVADAVSFSSYSKPMRDFIASVAAGSEDQPKYFVSSAHPRIVGQKRSKNPRYLQRRPDLADPRGTALADLARHLWAKAPLNTPLGHPVDVVAAGRRNNAAEDGVPPLCTYSPLHYMELPELFMEFISSMTGKSPSTTGAGSEGAMTKGPFNPLASIIDLNAALLSFVLPGYDGWLSSAGVIGPKVRVDHDISLLIPEVFSRMTPTERDAKNLIAEGSLERLEDFEHRGEQVLASRLGYRMTERFASNYFGRIFLHPHVVFTEEMLRPELQDRDVFAESMATIVMTHQRVAQSYIDDGTIALAVPPIRALLQIMANGSSEQGWSLDSPEFRTMFERDAVLASSWYQERIDALHRHEVHRANVGLTALTEFADKEGRSETAQRLGIMSRRARLAGRLRDLESIDAQDAFGGTLGRQVLWHV